jgi:flavodoxin
MRVAVVYESLFGNTHQVAAAIARGIADARPDVPVEVLRVGEAHAIEPGAEGTGIRDWFGRLPRDGEGRRAAAFDTRLGGRFAGGAARGIAHHLRRLGYQVIAEPEGFLVEDSTEGPLREGELDRAQAWGADLVRRLTPAAIP